MSACIRNAIHKITGAQGLGLLSDSDTYSSLKLLFGTWGAFQAVSMFDQQQLTGLLYGLYIKDGHGGLTFKPTFCGTKKLKTWLEHFGWVFKVF